MTLNIFSLSCGPLAPGGMQHQSIPGQLQGQEAHPGPKCLSFPATRRFKNAEQLQKSQELHFELYSNQRTNHQHNPQIKTNTSCPRVALVAEAISVITEKHKVSLYHGPSCGSPNLAGVRILTGLGPNRKAGRERGFSQIPPLPPSLFSSRKSYHMEVDQGLAGVWFSHGRWGMMDKREH